MFSIPPLFAKSWKSTVCVFSPSLLTSKGGSFEPLEPPLLRAWFSCWLLRLDVLFSQYSFPHRMLQRYQRLIGDYSGNLATCCRRVPQDGQPSDLGLPINNNALRYLRPSTLSFSPAQVKLALWVLSMTMIFTEFVTHFPKGISKKNSRT